MARWTEQDWRKPPMSAGAVNAHETRSKYGNRKLKWQGLQFDSLKELEDYKGLKLREAAGEIRAVVRQVSFPLQGSTRRIRVDFLLVGTDGTKRFVDSKGGHITNEWLLKQKLVKDQYGIDIEVM